MSTQDQPQHVRVRIDLAYDGTGFAGWARQPGHRSVQQSLEEALATVLRSESRGDAPPRTVVAGRTDAGVHARGQVVHTDLPPATLEAVQGRSDRPPVEVLRDRLDGLLPDDVVVHRVRLAPEGFDARFGALRRRYTYRVCDDPAARDPLQRAHVLWHRRPLDDAAMRAAGADLVGRHDFAAFCRRREGATTIRTLERFDWVRPADGPDAGLLVAHVQADAFCHSMVRSLVGACLAVGEGRRPPGWAGRMLDSRGRGPESFVAAARGLTLEHVEYPSDDELAGRAARTRARRAADDVHARPAADAAGTPCC